MDHQDKIAIIEHVSHDKRICLSYHQIESISNDFYQKIYLSRKNHDITIGIYMQRSALQVMAIIAQLQNGIRFFNLHLKYPVPYLFNIVQQCQAEYLIIDQHSLLKITQSLEILNSNLKFIFITEGTISQTQKQCLDKINHQYPLEIINLDQTRPNSSQTAKFAINPNGSCLLFTSGSTGTPKGVLVSNQDLILRIQSEIDCYALTSSDRLLNLLPFSFDVGFNQLLSALSCGATLVILNSWFIQDIYQSIINYEISGLSAVPLIWNDLLTLPSKQLHFISQQLRYLAISGGDLPEVQLKKIAQCFCQNQIYKTYGQTETFRSSLLFPHEFQQKIRSVGKPVTGTNVIILDQNHQPAKPFETGEILHQGLGSMIGYWNDPDATSNKIKQLKLEPQGSTIPYICTGDIGCFDDEGYLYLIGRNDDMLKIQGTRIYPQEIVSIIKKLDAVHEAVVVGIHDTNEKISIYAMVQLSDNQFIKPEDIIKYSRIHLPSLMIPRHVFIVDSIPRTINGKIDITAVSDYIKRNTLAL